MNKQEWLRQEVLRLTNLKVANYKDFLSKMNLSQLYNKELFQALTKINEQYKDM